MHYWLTHTMPIFFRYKNEPQYWQTSLSYELDNKSSKYLSRERSIVFRAQPTDSPWAYRAESNFRKNIIDQYASRKFILNDSQASEKFSLGVEYNDISQAKMRFQNIDAELALNSPQFLKLNCQRAQRINFMQNKFCLSYSLNCGIVQNLSRMLGLSSAQNLKINDRLFV